MFNETNTKIIHVIGLVGAGKSTFIHRYMNEFPAFDIHEIYRQSGHTQAELMDNPKVNAQFRDALKFNFEKFITLTEGAEWVAIESSGMNSSLNQILTDYDVYTLLITSKFPQTIYAERPYAKELNEVIRTQIKEKLIPFDCIFDWRSEAWVRAPKTEVLNLFPSI